MGISLANQKKLYQCHCSPSLLHPISPFLGALDPIMSPPEQRPLPLLQPPEELLPLAPQVPIIRLPGMQANVRSPDHIGLPQDTAQLLLVKQVQQTHAHAVQVHALVAQGDGAGVGAQGVEDGLGEAGGHVQGDGGLGVVAVGGEGEHFGEPEGEG